jgi:hypothetical protein
VPDSPDINAGAWYLRAAGERSWEVCEPVTGEVRAQVMATGNPAATVMATGELVNGADVYAPSTLARLAAEQRASGLVAGHPLNADGSAGGMGARVCADDGRELRNPDAPRWQHFRHRRELQHVVWDGDTGGDRECAGERRL